MTTVADIITDVEAELARATARHGPMQSAHEGIAVIEEEFLELRAEVFKGGSEARSWPAMREEAIQLAAMAIRFVHDGEGTGEAGE